MEIIRCFMAVAIIAVMIAEWRVSKKASREEPPEENTPNEPRLTYTDMVYVAKRTAICCGKNDPCLVVSRDVFLRLKTNEMFLNINRGVCADNGDGNSEIVLQTVPKFMGITVYVDEDLRDGVLYAESEASHRATQK